MTKQQSGEAKDLNFKKAYSTEDFRQQGAKLAAGGSDPDITQIASVSSDPELESNVQRKTSQDSLEEDAEDLSSVKKKGKKKLGRIGSTGTQKKPARSTYAATSSSESGGVPSPKGRSTVGVDTFPGPDEGTHPMSPSSSSAKYDPLQQRSTGQARKSSLMIGCSGLVTARRSVNQSKPMMTEEQQVDWETRASRVATVMFMSNAELAKGIKALEKDEVDEVAELYGLFDTDSNGTLDDVELGSLIRALGFKANQEQIYRVLRWLDDEESPEKQPEKYVQPRKTIMQMISEKAVDFDSFVRLMLKLRAEGPPPLARKVHRPEIVDSKGKPIKQTFVLLDALEQVLGYRDETWPPDGVPKKKLKDQDVAIKGAELLLELSKSLIKEREMVESLANDLLIFKAQLQQRNKKGVQEISSAGGKHNTLKMEHGELTKEVQAAQEELANEKEKYSALRNAAVPELAALDAEVALLKKKVEGWEQRVREDSLCARDLAELQKAKESRIRELAPKVIQCSDLQKKCQASYQVNVVLKSLLLQCCSNFDSFIEKKEAPLKHLESCGLDVHKTIQGLLTDHARLSKASVAAPDGVPDPVIPAVSASGAMH